MRSASATDVPPNFCTIRRPVPVATTPEATSGPSVSPPVSGPREPRLPSAPVPTDKRQRQREGRQARMEELRLAQQRSRQRRRFIIFGVIAVVIIGLIYISTRGSKSKKQLATTTTST